MAVSSVTKISASSTESFDDAIKQGFDRASKTVRGITDIKVLEQTMKVKQGISISEYSVVLELSFVLEG